MDKKMTVQKWNVVKEQGVEDSQPNMLSGPWKQIGDPIASFVDKESAEACREGLNYSRTRQELQSGIRYSIKKEKIND